MDFSVFKNTRFLFILFTAFLSVLGIGLIIPVIPFIVAEYVGESNQNAIAMYVGLLISAYSVCQFFAAPVLGAVSDRYGRRPVILLCLLGSAIGYVLFGIGGSLAILFIARIIDGLTGGDIGAIMAYIADITEPKDRGKYFGIVGAIVGLGFMLGPTVGGVLSHISLSAPVFFAAGITLLNMIFGYFVLPESHIEKHRMADFSLHHLNPFSNLSYVLKKQLLTSLLMIGFFYFLAFSMMVGINSVYYKDIMRFSPSDIGLIFFFLGIGDMFTQGYLNGKLTPKFGSVRLVLFGFLLTGVAFAINALLPLFPIYSFVLVYVVVYALGSGLFEPSMASLVSHAATPTEQGRVQGGNQSMQSITRIIGPLLAAFLYPYGHNVPFIICTILSLIGLLLVLQKQSTLQKLLVQKTNV